MLKQPKQLKTYKIYVNMTTMVKNSYILPSEMLSLSLVQLVQVLNHGFPYAQRPTKLNQFNYFSCRSSAIDNNNNNNNNNNYNNNK